MSLHIKSPGSAPGVYPVVERGKGLKYLSFQIVELGGKLARDLGVRFAGIDLMCSDISVPMSESGGVFNEINTTPGIHHHYLVAEPEKAVPVAELVLDYLFSHRQGVMVL